MNAAERTEKKDIFQRVTDQIVEAIEAGADSYKMPWNLGGHPKPAMSGQLKTGHRG